MSIAVRTAGVGDIAAMHRIRLSVSENRLSRDGRVTEASYSPFVSEGNAWVAEEEGTILGFVALDAGDASVWALFVAPGVEGRGVGRLLHDRLLAAAREQGIARLRLSTAPATRAEDFYAKAGWRRAGTTAAGEVRFEMDI